MVASHHILVSHGKAVPIIRNNVQDAKVGITLNLCPSEPASPSSFDADANRHFDGFFNRWYMDPVFGKGYPADMIQDYVALEHMESEPDWIQEGDMDTIAVETDFIGINYYSRAVIRSDKVPEEENEPKTVFDDGPRTAFDWEVHAPSLRRILSRLHHEYGAKSIHVTEMGVPIQLLLTKTALYQMWNARPIFKNISQHAHAISEGIPLDGYFAWSLLIISSGRKGTLNALV